MKSVHAKATWLQLEALGKAGGEQLSSTSFPPVPKARSGNSLARLTRGFLVDPIRSFAKPPTWTLVVVAMAAMVGIGGAAIWHGHINKSSRQDVPKVVQPQRAAQAIPVTPVVSPEVVSAMPRGDVGPPLTAPTVSTPKKHFRPREYHIVTREHQGQSDPVAQLQSPSVTIKAPCAASSGRDCSAASGAGEEFLTDKGTSH